MTGTNQPASLPNVRLIKGGKDYFSLLLELIATAKHHIHLQTYIFDDDDTGVLVGEALKDAARRGVKVYLLADGFASRVMSHKFIHQLKEAGVHFRYFDTLFRSRHFYFGRRMHHKVFVADAKHCIVGGINIANRYNDLPGRNAWLDYALYAEAEVAQELCVLCWKTWYSFPVHMPKTPCEQHTAQSPFSAEPAGKIRMRRNDWVRKKNEISATYIEMFRTARSHILIICSYFLPGRVIRRLLSAAAKRGVTIEIITAGLSDVRLSKPAERWLYDWLLRNNITLYEYQPNVLHAKMATCDGQWLTIGSYNVNNISAYTSIELNLEIRDEHFARQTEKMLHEIIATDCIRITKESHRKSGNVFRQLYRWFSYHLIRLIFHMITFYYRQEKKYRKQ